MAFCHTFYSLGDGGALAFFSFADDEVYQKCQAAAPAEIQAFDHVAFKVDDAVYDETCRSGEGGGRAGAGDRPWLLPFYVPVLRPTG